MRGQFDIFAGTLEGQPFWLEATNSLPNANERMKRRAQVKPGCYFVFSGDTHAVVASIDTDACRANHVETREPQ